MTFVITWLEEIAGSIPLPLLEVWGRFSYLVGLVLCICAFGGFTFRIGGRWGFGRERVTWDAKAFLSVPLTSVLIIAASYIGSFIVLVPGAQTFESLKDLVVLLCIVMFGYPALIAVPPAYMLADLMEGVPPAFVLELGRGLLLLDGLRLAGVPAPRPESGFPPREDLAALRRVRRADHAARSGDVGIHLLGRVHVRHFLPEHFLGAVLHAAGHVDPGADRVSRRLPAGQALRMVLGGDSRPRSRPRAAEPRVDLGDRAR